MPEKSYLFLATAVMFAMTYALRAFPFLIFGKGRRTPGLILYIGRVISPAVIAALIVYCLKGTKFTAPLYGGAEIAALLICFILHKTLHNPLISILGSTAVYMAMVQLLG